MTTSDAQIIEFPVRTGRDEPPHAHGLRNARFGIDGAPPYFWGYNTGRKWNGWDVPSFCREVICVIQQHVNDAHDERLSWSGDVLVFNNPDTGVAELVVPDANGHYTFDGWAWLEEDDA